MFDKLKKYWVIILIVVVAFGHYISSGNGGNSTEINQLVQNQQITQTVYITRTGEKYHRNGCRYLSKSQIPISLSDAQKNYTPCSICKP